MHPSVTRRRRWRVRRRAERILSARRPRPSKDSLTADLAAPGGRREARGRRRRRSHRTRSRCGRARTGRDRQLLRLDPGVPPVGPGYWVSAPAAIVRRSTALGLLPHRARISFAPHHRRRSGRRRSSLPSPRFARSPIHERPSSSRSRSSASWGTGPFTAGNLNLIADRIIVDHHRTEREAARILAFANAAAFDAQIACFDAKFTYWFIRPSQADPAITLPIGTPEPSVVPIRSLVHHQCVHDRADRCVSERAGRVCRRSSRTPGSRGCTAGIHYRFDIEAGQAIGRGAAALALAASRK